MASALRRWFGAALLGAALGLAPASGATSFSTNFSDLWWIPAESGWGANVTQQAGVMFVTIFVFGQAGQPTWYAGTLYYSLTAPDGSLVFTGDLYQTVGPWFGAAFDPGLVNSRQVGTATFRSAVVAQATLAYTVDGTPVTKQIVRQTLRNNDMSGTYFGGMADVTYNCVNFLLNNRLTEDTGQLNVTQVAPLITLKAPTCTFAGTYSQQGQIGRADTTYVCNNGAAGTATFFDLHVETSGIVGRYTGRDPLCSFDGNIGGYRKK